MNKLCVAIILVTFFSCNGKTDRKSAHSIKSNYSKKSVDSLVKAGVISKDDIDLLPSQAEERERLSKTYDDIKIVDSTFVIQNDTVKFRLKYYCLKNVNLIIPKFFDGDKDPKDFLTHPFVTDILLVSKGDTVLNKQFRASDFYPFFTDQFDGNLKKYASIIEPGLYRKNNDKNHIMVGFSISIPSTDLGIGMSLMIAKNGTYKIIK